MASGGDKLWQYFNFTGARGELWLHSSLEVTMWVMYALLYTPLYFKHILPLHSAATLMLWGFMRWRVADSASGRACWKLMKHAKCRQMKICLLNKRWIDMWVGRLMCITLCSMCNRKHTIKTSAGQPQPPKQLVRPWHITITVRWALKSERVSSVFPDLSQKIPSMHHWTIRPIFYYFLSISEKFMIAVLSLQMALNTTIPMSLLQQQKQKKNKKTLSCEVSPTMNPRLIPRFGQSTEHC